MQVVKLIVTVKKKSTLKQCIIGTFFSHVIEERNWNVLWNYRRKLSWGNQPEKMLDELTKWLYVGRVTDALKVTRDRDAWKVTIAYAKEQGT